MTFSARIFEKKLNSQNYFMLFQKSITLAHSFALDDDKKKTKLIDLVDSRMEMEEVRWKMDFFLP